MQFPPYKGSTLRGGFGSVFKETVCVVEHRDCSRCLLRTRCAFPYVFDTPVPEDARRLLFIRWKLPEEIAAIGESENVRSVVHEQSQNFLRSFFPDLAVTIMHTLEDPKDAPKATWS